MRALLVAAILGGILRIANVLAVRFVGPLALQISYAGTDAALILGYVGIVLVLRQRIGMLGIAGAALGIVGLLAIRLTIALHFELYMVGAAFALFGTALLAIELLIKRAPSPIAAAAWLAAAFWLVAVFTGAVPPAQPSWAIGAGFLFAAGFIVEGVALLRAP
ncbi:MAG: hypothetical protein ACREHE_07990 [Rhizomicrobium sp.]